MNGIIIQPFYALTNVYQQFKKVRIEPKNCFHFLNHRSTRKIAPIQRNKMKHSNKSTQRQSLKLPSIGNKTMDSIYRETQQGKNQRPMSSKNSLVGDLEKRLFSQLQAYEQKSQTVKQKHIKTKSAKSTLINTNGSPTIIAGSCKDISSNTKLNNLTNNENENMEKIAQLMPQLYSKIIQSKKVEQIKPLKGIQKEFLQDSEERGVIEEKKVTVLKKMGNLNNTDNQQTLITQPLQQPMKLSTRTSMAQKPTSKPKLSSTSTHSIQQKPQSLTFAEQQIDSIYQQYLQSQGLDQTETSVKQLAELNVDLERCEVDIQQLQRNYSLLIKQLGDLCVKDVIQ